ncbi:hypothetical protein MKK88_01115 [Methylobacterium sp. E-005]|uniref:hypothetical protein n=1 Tax=Methylobacterium sp. E-005 TaxID=2836549 RepID=UPI001FB90116|nr:hypothetical protein [Methylobacterium sp. E-005]MCJ2084596.1 hypothetical protein [Methylobacterium sp. E-005]
MDEGAETAKEMIGREDNGWPALAPSTVAEKTRLGMIGRISATDPLYRKGTMRESFGSSAGATGDGAEGAIGSTSGIAAFHENGTSRMPPRPIFMPTMIKIAKRSEDEFGHMAIEQLTPGIR